MHRKRIPWMICMILTTNAVYRIYYWVETSFYYLCINLFSLWPNSFNAVHLSAVYVYLLISFHFANNGFLCQWRACWYWCQWDLALASSRTTKTDAVMLWCFWSAQLAHILIWGKDRIQAKNQCTCLCAWHILASLHCSPDLLSPTPLSRLFWVIKT